MSDNKNPVVEVAKEQSNDGIYTLSTGVRIKFLSPNPALLAEVLLRVPVPEVPMWYNESKGREEPNPNDPAYLEARERMEYEQAAAMMEAQAMFGFELVDGLPEDDGWLHKLELLGKLGRLDLSPFDLEHPIDQEFLYRKHVAVATEDWTLINSMAGVTSEGVASAEDSF